MRKILMITTCLVAVSLIPGAEASWRHSLRQAAKSFWQKIVKSDADKTINKPKKPKNSPRKRPFVRKCTICNGSGKIYDYRMGLYEVCSHCHGDGLVTKSDIWQEVIKE